MKLCRNAQRTWNEAIVVPQAPLEIPAYLNWPMSCPVLQGTEERVNASENPDVLGMQQKI